MHPGRLSCCRAQKTALKHKWNLSVEMVGKFQSKDSLRWGDKQFISKNFGTPFAPVELK